MIKPKIMIVEDQEKVADAIGRTCEKESMVPVVVYNGEDAIAAFNEHDDIALVVLDINLPDINGFEVCRALREKSKVPILFMTARKDDIDEVSGLEMGADGYIKKPVKPRTVIAHIRAALRRANDWAEQEKSSDEEKEEIHEHHPDFIVNNETKVITYKGQQVDLTSEEFIILSKMIQQPRRVFSRDQIVGMIDEDIFILPKSVNTRIQRIRRKLTKIAPDSEFLIPCRGEGYKFIL